MKTIRCAELWGGCHEAEEDICTSGVTAALYSRSSEGRRGGDVYYFSVCAWDVLTRVCLADLRGHGEGVAELSEWIYAQMLDKMNEWDGSLVLEGLNEVLHQRGFQALTTAVVLSYNKEDQLLQYACAGHPPALWRQSGRDWQRLGVVAPDGPANLPLGVMRNAVYTQTTWQGQPNDRVFLYTDGVLECPSPEGEEFMAERLERVLREGEGEDVNQLRRRVVGELEAFRGGALDHDDCTLLALELH